MVIFDPNVCNITIISEMNSLSELEREYLADPLASWLIPKGSLLGWTFTWLYGIFEFFGWCSAHKNFQTVVKTAQVGIDKLKNYLADPQGDPAGAVSTFLSLSFDPAWKTRLSRVNRLLYGQNDLPSFDNAQRVAAPMILQEICRAPIPWDLFAELIHQNRLSGPSERRLHEWIHDVKLWGASISPFLMLSLCEAAAYKSLADRPPGVRGAGAFFLAWTLYKAGLSELSSPDLGNTRITEGETLVSDGQGEVRVGQPILLPFPTDFPLIAHEVQGHNDLMALTSSSPLLLGMWVHNVRECPSPIPCAPIISCDPRGRYVITKRLAGTLEAFRWDEGREMSPHSRALFDTIVDLAKKILSLQSTLDLELNHLFLTPDFELHSIAPVQQRFPFFCLPVVEQFLRETCRGDEVKLQRLFREINLWRHPAAQLYRSLIEKFSFAATDPDISRELAVFGLDEKNFLSISEWVRLLRRHIARVHDRLKSTVSFACMSPREQTATIVSLVIRLQEEMGWISCVPHDLADRVVEMIMKRENKAKEDPVMALAAALM